MLSAPHLSLADLVVIGLYIGGLLIAGILDRRHMLKARDLFLAGQSASWPRVGFAMYASTISVTSLVGLTGSAYAHGISVFNYEWMAAVVLTVFCAFVLPTYLRSKVFTVPEFLELRYGRFVRTYVSGLSIALGIGLDASGALFAGAVLFQILCPGWPLWQVCALLALLAGGFLMAGGLRAVMLIESIQGAVLVIACASIAFFTFSAIGHATGGGVMEGWHVVLTRLDHAHLKLINPASDAAMPWTGLVTGVPLIGFYFWCTNQTMVQRVLAAKSLDDGRRGSLLGGALKLSNLFLVILPGAGAILLFPHLAAPDQVFSHLVFDILPPGLTGLILAACLISILSGLASIYNAMSTLLTIDFIQRLKPDLTERQLVLTGRLAAGGLMVISILWAPQILHVKDTLWQYLQAILCYFVPPIAAVFLAGLVMRRVNATGAAAALILGTASSFVLFFGVEIAHIIPLHFLVAAAVIFVISLTAIIVASLLAPAPDADRIAPLMFTASVWRDETAQLKGVRPWRNYRILSLALLIVTAAIVIAFR